MSVTQYVTAGLGSSRTGLVGRVAYSLDNGTTWTTTGITEPITGSGNYLASVTVTPPVTINWKTGDSDMLSSIVSQTSGGSGYTNGTGYALIFTGGAGTGASGTFDVINGSVQNIKITGFGQNYTSAPTLSFSNGGAGTGAAATCSLRSQRYASEAISQQILAPAGMDTVTAEPAAGTQPSINIRQAVTLMFDSGVYGQVTNANTSPSQIFNPAGTVQRATITQDQYGNRPNIAFNNLP